jgi:hypothetical protein
MLMFYGEEINGLHWPLAIARRRRREFFWVVSMMKSFDGQEYLSKNNP